MAFKKVRRDESFARWFIDEFGVDKFNSVILHEKNIANGIDVWSISKGSGAEIWFRCENKDYHEYCMPAYRYLKGNRCKYCTRTKYVHPLDSFGQYIIDNYGKDFLDKIWSDKNDKSPFKYTVHTEQKVHLNCPRCGAYMGTSQIHNFVLSKMVCPKCKGAISALHQKAIDYLRGLNYELNTEYDCTIIPINPATKYPLPYDIEVKDVRLIIEVNGRQHYEEVGNSHKWLHGLSSAECLAKRKKYDEYKKSFALTNGYFYLEIPYWAEKNDQYKILINEKINEIHNMRTTTDTREGYHG